ILVHELPHLLACKLPWLRLLGPPIAIEVCRTLPAAKLMPGSSDVLPKIFLHTAFNTGHNQGFRPDLPRHRRHLFTLQQTNSAVDSDHRRPEMCRSEVKPVKLASGKLRGPA